jgi:hypothetical protein
MPDSDSANRYSKKEGKHPLEYFIAVFLVLTFIATAFAAYYAREQWLTAVDNEKRQLRAYVGIESLNVECGSCNDEKYVPTLAGTLSKDFFRISVRNSGKTPAKKLRNFINWVSTPWPSDLPIDFKFEDGAKINVPGTVDITALVAVQPNTSYESIIKITDATPLINARSKKTILWVFGHIDYVDIFDATRVTTFCYVYEPWRDPEQLYSACGRQNDAT